MAQAAGSGTGDEEGEKRAKVIVGAAEVSIVRRMAEVRSWGGKRAGVLIGLTKDTNPPDDAYGIRARHSKALEHPAVSSG
jgi:hypothetical protein